MLNFSCCHSKEESKPAFNNVYYRDLFFPGHRIIKSISMLNKD